MYFKSKKISSLILTITAIACSRTMLVSIDDPEGPNLLIVMVMAAFIYFLSLAIYVYSLKVVSVSQYFSLTQLSGIKRLIIIIFIQILTAATFYFCLR